MKQKRDRFFALFGAILFFVTASALTITIIFDSVSRKDDKTANNQTQSQAQQSTEKQEANKLQGKPLPDFTPISKVDQLQVIDTTPGTGEAVKSGDTITADYTGAVAASGTVFQSSLDSGQPFTAVVGKGQLIKGWDEGIIGMKIGGTRRLVIPADKAYGANPPGGSGIPANADLVFNITLHKIGS